MFKNILGDSLVLAITITLGKLLTTLSTHLISIIIDLSTLDLSTYHHWNHQTTIVTINGCF